MTRFHSHQIHFLPGIAEQVEILSLSGTGVPNIFSVPINHAEHVVVKGSEKVRSIGAVRCKQASTLPFGGSVQAEHVKHRRSDVNLLAQHIKTLRAVDQMRGGHNKRDS